MTADYQRHQPRWQRERWRIVTQLLFCALVMVYPPAVLAHVLQTDGDMGVLMHVDPDDEPVAGQQATFLLEIQNRRGPFQLDRCNCRLRISEQGKEVFSGRIGGADNGSVAVPFVFPDSGVYRAEVAGEPLAGAVFPAFRVGFDVRVIPEEATEIPWSSLVPQHWLLILLALAAVLLMLMRKLWRRK
jgi:hypothetical protein